ncbi:MAG: response regulator [SAR324 cluster bacterium]|nr:response regulator [SAR324 cluster bacterium]
MATILVIDDQQDNLIVLSTLLQELLEDAKVVTAQSGAEGIEKAKHEKPDTILLDVIMPEMDGFEACLRLKSNEQTKHIPVIMLTAIQSDVESRTKALELGADAFLSKPVDETELIAQINAMLRIKKAEDQLIQEKDLLSEQVQKKVTELQRSEEKFRKVCESAQEAIIMLNHEGKIALWNFAAETIFGYNRSEVMGKDMHQLIAPQHYHEKIKQGFSQFLTTGKGPLIGKTLEITALKKDGTEFLIELSISAVQLDDQWNAIGVIRDITERKNSEEARIQLESQLRQAQKMEAIGTLAGGIAHDFNNILQGIFMSIQLTRMQLPEFSQEKEFLDQAFEFSRRGADLVKQILTFSRQTDQKHAVIQIAPIIKEIMRMMRSTLPTTIDICHNISNTCGSISGSPTQIHQVVMNLCMNAGYAMQEEGGVLNVALEEVVLNSPKARALGLEEGMYLKLHVNDTGTGMSEKVLEHIFEPFFSTKPKGEGTGLGLSVVHGIVQDHKGVITVESEVDRGTTFEVFFPAIQQNVQQPEKDTLFALRGNENILLVDDETEVVKIEKIMLEGLGYKVTTASSGNEALKIFLAAPDQFDLVLTDQTMPKMTGDQLARELLKNHPDLPIILVTGFSHKMNEITAEEIGIKGFLTKPVDNDQIGLAIRKALDHKG